MLLAWAGQARVAKAAFPPSHDNALYESAAGGLSNGAGDGLFVGRTSPTRLILLRAMLAFDVAGQIPSASVIDSAGLALTVTDVVAPMSDLVFSPSPLVSDWEKGFRIFGGERRVGRSPRSGR